MDTNLVSGELLRSFVERIEQLDASKQQIADDRSAVLAEAKANGFVPAVIKAVIKIRKMKPSERQEAEALLDCYMHALGEEVDTPLFRAAGMMSVDTAVKEQVIEALKKFVPSSGAITVEAGGVPVRLTRDPDGNVSVTEVKPKPAAAPASQGRQAAAAARPDVPGVDGDGAEALGRQAFRDDQAIIANPFPFGDARRPRWDKGWRDESGGDGMDD